ncbi:MAG: RagB/SusD family nutrient uptake outer membrane protein [Niabella sp.]|nr:RagB/SusD family nutrient uptake outer membrane protein [Niabella sp.]
MKKYTTYKTALIILLFAVILSCGRSFLDVAPQGQVTEEQALTDPAAADKMVAGIYNQLYSQGTFGVFWSVLGNIASDDADKGSTPSDNGFNSGDVDNFTFTPAAIYTVFNNVWTNNYSGIVRANKALSILDQSSIDGGIKNRLTGEAKFLRGLFYFNLVRAFGGVPKIIRTPADPQEGNSDEFQTRVSAQEIYNQIVADFQVAVDNLPAKGDAGTQVGRANKGAAQAILAKVYLYLKDWQKAYDLSFAVMQSGKYSLATDYAAVFRESGNNNSESVFEIQTGPSRSNSGACDGVSPSYGVYQGVRARSGWPSNRIAGKTYSGDLGFGLNNPSADLANAYEGKDVRKAGTIIFINQSGPTILWDGFRIPKGDSVENQRYNYKSYHSPFLESVPCNGDINNKDNWPINIRVMRFSEVLLINAEAAMHIGQDAVTPLTRVRQRAGLDPAPATEENIWKERRVELAMESDRFFDLVRQGRAASVLASKGFVAGKNELFPIPQAQIDLSGNRLKQNPGY